MSETLNKTYKEIFNSNLNVIFIEKSWAKRISVEYRRRLKQHALADNFYQFDASQLTEDTIASYLLKGSESAEEMSNYRKTVDVLEARQTGVFVFYQSHLMNSDTLQFVSRVMRSSKRQNLAWRFIFFGKAAALQQAAVDTLLIERFYPDGSKQYVASAVESDVTSTGSRSDSQGDTRSKAPLVLMLIGVLLTVFALGYYFIFLQKSNSDQAEVDPFSNGVKITETEQTTAVTLPNASLLEVIRQSKLRDLEFKGILEQIDEEFANSNSIQPAPVPRHTDNQEQQHTLLASTQLKDAANKAVRADTDRPVAALTVDVENAIRVNDLDTVKELLSGSDLMAGQNGQGETPLIMATYNGHGQIVKWLLNENVAVNSKDKHGRTALFYASINGNDVLLERLIDAGAQVDVKSDLLKTPLMAAVHNNHVTIAETLLSRRVDVNVKDHSGWSALFYAAWNSNVSMVELLINNGADTSLVDSSGLTAKDIATARGHTELLELL